MKIRIPSLYILIAALAVTGCKKKETSPDKPAASCVAVDTLALNDGCLAASVLASTGNTFPNPSSSNDPVKMKLKIAGVDSALSLIDASVTTQLWSMNGQAVGTQSSQVASASAMQDVTIWQSASTPVASGLYFVGVTVDLGVCGKKTICLENRHSFVN